MTQDRTSAMERLLAVPTAEESPVKELFSVDGTLKMKSEIPPGLILHLARAYTIADLTKSKILLKFCVPEGTKITVKNSKYSGLQGTSEYVSRNIEELAVGDEVLTYNTSTMEKEFKKITMVHQKLSGDFCQIKFSNNNELVLTPEHPVGVIKNNGELEWICAADVKVGMEVVQLLYKGLELRCRQLGRSREEIYGSEKAEEIIEKISLGVKKDWEVNHEVRKAAASANIAKWNTFKSGKTYEELYGAEKAEAIENKQSQTHKKLCEDPLVREVKRRVATDSWKDPSVVSRRLLHMAATNATPETKRRKAEATAKSWLDKEIRASRCAGIKRAWEESPENWLQAFDSEEYSQLRSELATDLWSDPEYAKRMSDAHMVKIDEDLLRKLYVDEHMTIKQVMQMTGWGPWVVYTRLLKNGWNRSKFDTGMSSSEEEYYDVLIQQVFPSEWIHTGNSGFKIGGMIPDWKHANGQKKLLEYNGCYYHACELCGYGNVILPGGMTGKEKRERDAEKLRIFKENGHETLVFWGHDNENDVLNSIKQFLYNPNIELVSVIDNNVLNEETYETVYNLEVEGNNNYFAYGILIHNCDNVLQLQISKDRKGRIEMMESIIARIRKSEEEE